MTLVEAAPGCTREWWASPKTASRLRRETDAFDRYCSTTASGLGRAGGPLLPRATGARGSTGDVSLDQMPRRCEWANVDDPLLVAYHDEEWGVPSHQDRHLFELLTLEAAQAGLSWRTILHKREGYRSAFQQFEPARVAGFDAREIEALLKDPAIVRNRLKLESTVNNARRVLDVQGECGTFDAYIWQFVHGVPAVGRRRALRDLPSETPESKAMSNDLKRRGFRFVGPTVCYAFMQAAGLVNDHVTTCFRYRELSI
jgi:DNA-3-methyladenine glycosylase I